MSSWPLSVGPLSLLRVGLREAAVAAPPDFEGWLDDLPSPPLEPCSEVTAAVAEPGAGMHRVVIGCARAVHSLGAIFAAAPGERFYGFGERSDQAGRERGCVESYVGEGPYQLDEYPLIAAVVPPWGMRRRRDSTYFPIPWLLSSRGYGVLVENDETTTHRLRLEEGEWSLECEAAEVRLLVFDGPTPADALRRFTELTGRQPAPRPWFFGPWMQTGHANHVPEEEERRAVAAVLAAGAPLTAAETHLRYLPCGEHVGHRERERARTAHLRSQGLKVLSYLNPMVCREFEEAFAEAEAGAALLKTAGGAPYTFWAYVGGREVPGAELGQLDFTTAAGRMVFAKVLQQLVEDGHDGWMEDFGEYTPLDAVDSTGRTGSGLHNSYPREYHRAAAEIAGPEAARFVRSGWTGSAQFSPIVWGGDPTTAWGFDGLASAVTEALSAGLSGIAFWATDVGGFFSIGENRLTPELLVRWIQFGALCPVLRTKAGGVAIPPSERPQVWDPEILPHWTRWAGFHLRLVPYLVRAADEYAATGLPIVRHLGLVYPDDPAAAAVEDQYLLGPDLLVAPVLEPGATARAVYLPEGRWKHLWSDAAVTGPAAVTVPAPLAEIPVFARAGRVPPEIA